MSCWDKSVALELMVLKKPTALDELIDTVPKPKGAIPNFGLPRWKIMPLESKIPMIPGPEGSYHFTRKKLGKKLWVGSTNTEFNLNDPYNYEADWTYDPLHDEHLARYFSQPTNVRRMIKLGLVTKNLDAKCSIRDYNIYRKYLKTLHNDSINVKIKQKARMDFERRALYLAEKFAEKDAERMRAREKKIEASNQLLEKNRLEEEAKLKRRREKQLKIEQHLNDIALSKIEANKLRIEKAWERAEVLRQKQEMAAYIERQKIVRTIQRWRESERQRRIAKAKRELEEKEEKQKAVEEKWQIRQEMQKKQMDREEFLQRCSHEERVMNIKAYNTKVEKERARMRRLSEEYKKFTKCYIERHVAGQKVRTCCIKRNRPRRLGGSELGSSCMGKSYHIERDESKFDEKGKGDNAKSKKHKKRKIKRKKKKRIIETVANPEPEKISTIFKPPPTIQEHNILKDNCKCERIKAEWLKNQQIENRN